MLADYEFPVELRAISTEPDGFVIPHRRAVIRTDTMKPLGVVSDKYALLPHAAVVDTMRETLKGQDTKETIRLTHNGARMHFEITLPDVTFKVEGDEIAMRLVVANSYDGSRKVHIAFGAYRLICANGMTIGSKLVSLNRRHVGEVSLEVEHIRKQMTTLTALFKATEPTIRKMVNRPLWHPKPFFNAKSLRIPGYLVKIARDQFKQVEDGTIWDAYNALTFAITHKMRKANPELATRLGKNAWAAASAAIK